MTNPPTILVSDALHWTGPHGLSLGGSFKGTHLPSLTGYWIHDHVAGRRRFKVYKIGVTRQIGSAPTLEKAKAICLEHLTEGARQILADMKAQEQAADPIDHCGWVEEPEAADHGPDESQPYTNSVSESETTNEVLQPSSAMVEILREARWYVDVYQPICRSVAVEKEELIAKIDATLTGGRS